MVLEGWPSESLLRFVLQDLADKAKSAANDAKGAVKDAAGSAKGAAKDAADSVKDIANQGYVFASCKAVTLVSSCGWPHNPDCHLPLFSWSVLRAFTVSAKLSYSRITLDSCRPVCPPLPTLGD